MFFVAVIVAVVLVFQHRAFHGRGRRCFFHTSDLLSLSRGSRRNVGTHGDGTSVTFAFAMHSIVCVKAYLRILCPALEGAAVLRVDGCFFWRLRQVRYVYMR